MAIQQAVSAHNEIAGHPVHVDDPEKTAAREAQPHSTGFAAHFDELPQGYFYSRFFLGTYAALAVGLFCGCASFAYAAPVLAIINADIGPDKSFPWIAYVYNTAIAVTFPVVGRLSDIFGRRYYFCGGAALGLIGAIVCSRAQSVLVLIGGNALLGIASATQLSYHFVLGELVPTKYRYHAIAVLYTSAIPGSGFGPSIAYAMLKYSSGWRGIYYILIGAEAVALILWTAFYFPPKFHAKHGAVRKSEFIKNFDYLGTFLLIGGFIVFLFGISVGGNLFPWTSAATICMIVVGAVTLVVFGVYEYWFNPREAIAPPHIFTVVPWLASSVTVGFAASVYYTSAIVWPQQVASLYYPTDLTTSGLLANIPALANQAGQIIGGALQHYFGNQKIQVVVTFMTAGIFASCCAVVTTDNKAALSGLVFGANFFMGWVEIVCLVNSTIFVANQNDIGTAGGLAAGIRTGISAISTVVYGTVLTNELMGKVPAGIGAAAVASGLDPDNVGPLVLAITSGNATAVAAVPGASPSILAAADLGQRVAGARSYRTVYLVSIAFSALGIVASLFTKDPKQLLNQKVAATLGDAAPDGANTEDRDDENAS